MLNPKLLEAAVIAPFAIERTAAGFQLRVSPVDVEPMTEDQVRKRVLRAYESYLKYPPTTAGERYVWALLQSAVKG